MDPMGSVCGSLLVVGSVAFDSIETRAGKHADVLGGAATFISLSASHFCPVSLVAVVGENDFPEEHIRLLTSRGIDLQGLERSPGRTFRWSGVYAEDFSSRKTLETELGVFESFHPKVPKKYLKSRIVVLGNIHPALQLAVLDALDKDVFVIADTMNLWINTTRDALKQLIGRVDLLVINDEEAFMLTGQRQIAVAADKIRADGPSALMIKRGEHGAFLFAKDTVFFTPGIPLREVVDPTGAGDSFVGGLAGFLVSQGSTGLKAMKAGMLYGTALASMAVESFGAQKLAAITRSAIDARVSQLRKLVALES
jgi:sugar/nucleoside kinase (ribokinase family)